MTIWDGIKIGIGLIIAWVLFKFLLFLLAILLVV
jgi:hypothetical protein